MTFNYKSAIRYLVLLYIKYMYILFKGGDLKNEFDSNKTMNNLSIISNLLIIINSSVNFFVYLNKDPKFLLAFYHCISSSVESSCAEMCHVAPDTESCLLRWVHHITFHHRINTIIVKFSRRNCSRQCQYSQSERSRGMSNITHNDSSTVGHMGNKSSSDSAVKPTEDLSLSFIDILNDSESAKMTKKTVKVTDL